MLFSLFKNEVTNPQRNWDEVVEHEWAHEIHVKNEFCIRKDLVIFFIIRIFSPLEGKVDERTIHISFSYFSLASA